MPLTELVNNGQEIGGILALVGDPWQGVPPHWSLYFAGENCEQTVETAKGLGGNIHLLPADIPNVGKFSVIGDPQDAVFQVIQLLPQA